MPRKNNTTREARQRWDEQNLKKYGVALRTDSDRDLIAYIEAQKAAGMHTSEIFRAGLEKIKNGG